MKEIQVLTSRFAEPLADKIQSMLDEGWTLFTFFAVTENDRVSYVAVVTK